MSVSTLGHSFPPKQGAREPARMTRVGEGRQDTLHELAGDDIDEAGESDQEVEGLLQSKGTGTTLTARRPSLSESVPRQRRSSNSSTAPRIDRGPSWRGGLRKRIEEMGMGEMSRTERRTFIREMLTQVRLNNLVTVRKLLILYPVDAAHSASLAAGVTLYGGIIIDAPGSFLPILAPTRLTDERLLRQSWRVFIRVEELFILVPILLNLKGNLEMNLASRFSTSVRPDALGAVERAS